MLPELLIKAFWTGVAAIGFAALFNVPKRTFVAIGLVAATGGFVKFLNLHFDYGLVWSSLVAAVVVGSLSVPTARKWYSPPLVFAIPAIIPMVPGAFLYRMMLGLLEMGSTNDDISSQLVADTIHNGVMGLFVLGAIAIGAAIPSLVTRRQFMTSIKMNERK